MPAEFTRKFRESCDPGPLPVVRQGKNLRPASAENSEKGRFYRSLQTSAFALFLAVQFPGVRFRYRLMQPRMGGLPCIERAHGLVERLSVRPIELGSRL